MSDKLPSFNVFDRFGTRIGRLEPVENGLSGFISFAITIVVIVLGKMIADSFVETHQYF